jgi:hypothetical protein
MRLWSRASALRSLGTASSVPLARGVCALALVAAAWPSSAAAQMPDPRAMSGMSMPAPELADGTVTVRVVRDQISNNVAGVAVELHGAGDVRRATTGADGRAEFAGVPPGAQVHALAMVDGQRMESQPFDMPASGGVRTILVAGSDAAAGAGPPQAASPPADAPQPAGSASSLSIGGSSRIAAEFSDDVLQVFYLLEITNRTSAPVTPASALIFDMPTGAEGTTLLEGSTKNASAKGTRVTVPGPFPPGATPLQIAFRLDSLGSAATITSTFPLPMEAVSLAVQKIGSMTVSSPQVTQLQERSIETSQFVMGLGPRLAAQSPLVVQLDGLPYKSRLPVYVALALASAIVGAAVWFILFPGQFEAAGARRRALQQRRESGLAALATLEAQHRAGQLDEAQYTSRRATLVAQLERVYGELDLEGGTTPGGQGVAA